MLVRLAATAHRCHACPREHQTEDPEGLQSIALWMQRVGLGLPAWLSSPYAFVRHQCSDAGRRLNSNSNKKDKSKSLVKRYPLITVKLTPHVHAEIMKTIVCNKTKNT